MSFNVMHPSTRAGRFEVESHPRVPGDHRRYLANNPSLVEQLYMAGYFIYTLDGDAFSKLTTSPTDEQAMALARNIHDRIGTSKAWPKDINALAAAIKARLTQNDWYGDLSPEDAEVWDDVVFSLCGDTGKEVGIGFECSDYESIYWDCAEEAAGNGAEMLQEPIFGSSGYRFAGPLAHDYGYHRIYSIFRADDVQRLLSQLQSVESHFADLPDDGDGCVREQFFEGLLPPVKYAAENNRCIFVQTDT